MTSTHAFFCVTSPSVDVYETAAAPFAFILQFFMGESLVVMPVASLLTLASEVEVATTERELTFISMTARCGSTLLCQMTSRLPGVEVISEPWSLEHLHADFLAGKFEMGEYKRRIAAAVRLQCKSGARHTVIKLPVVCAPQFVLLKELFPRAKLVFITRHPGASANSLHKVFSTFPAVQHYLGIGAKFWVENLPFPYDDKDLTALRRSYAPFSKWYWAKDSEMWPYGYGGALLCFLRNRDIYDFVVTYEDLKENVGERTVELLRILGLDKKGNADLALAALQTHSQGEMFGASGKASISERELREQDESYRRIGLPDVSNFMEMKDFQYLVYGE